jgi:quercetin dioxygenase-like cupin family protein
MEQATSTEWRAFIKSTEDVTFRHADCLLQAVTHPAGQASPVHTHPEDHIIVMRAGRMRWTVAEDSLDAWPGDTIVTPAEVPHSFEVLGGAAAQCVCIVCPPPKSE